MPLITCPDCKRKISDAVRSCPHCGRPIDAADVAHSRDAAAEGAKRAAIGCGVAGLAVLLLFAWCYNAISSTSTNSTPAVPQPSAAGAYVDCQEYVKQRSCRLAALTSPSSTLRRFPSTVERCRCAATSIPRTAWEESCAQIFYAWCDISAITSGRSLI